MERFPYDLLMSIMAGLSTAFAAFFTQYLSRKRQKEKEIATKEIASIAEVLQREEASTKATVMERVVERIPVGLSKEQFSTLLGEIASRLPSQNTSSTATANAVENLVNNYHGQALNQAKVQFWFSIGAASVGFAWILITGADIKDVGSVSRTLPGIVMDAVAFLFFRQAAETRQRATELYDRLRKDKLMAESVTLVASIEDSRVRSAVKAQMALHMSGLQPAPIDLGTFLSQDPSGKSEIKA